VQPLEKINCRFGLRGAEYEIGKRGGPHRGRAGSAAELCEHDRNLAKPAFVRIAAEGGDTLSDQLGPYRCNVLRRWSTPDAIGAPLLAEKPAQGIPEHLPNVVAWELDRVHWRN
jgi:hypothetical protein